MGSPFRHPLRVRWSECDAQGVVFYPNYLALVDVAMTELWRAAGVPYGEMVDGGADCVVAEANVRYRDSARFDDQIEVVVEIARFGETSMTSAIEIRRTADDALLAEVDLRHVFVDPATFAKRPIPADIRAALGRFAAAAPADA